MKTIDILRNLKTREDFERERISHIFYRTYEEANARGLEILNFDNLGFEKDYKEIAENLERFGFNEFAISETSTGLMNALLFFTKRGFTITDVTEFETGHLFWDFEANKPVPQIKNAIIFKK